MSSLRNNDTIRCAPNCDPIFASFCVFTRPKVHFSTAWRFCVVLLLVASCTRSLAQTPAKPIIGAIRWDGWWSGAKYETNLNDEQWRDRLPFYAKVKLDASVEVRSDTPKVMDKEIDYARHGGIDFWAFCYYHPRSWREADRFNYGWQLYLSSKKRLKPNFCFILQGGSHMGPKEEWPQTADQFVRMFQMTSYQKVCGNRPLLFVFSCENIAPMFGSEIEAHKAFDLLRSKSRAAGAGDPYVVAQVFSASDGAKYLDAFGWNAISSYSAPGGGEHREYPYSSLAEANPGYWERFRATGKQVIPTVNAGWDGRPRLTELSIAKYYSGPWYTMPTPAELADNLRSAVAWNRANQANAEANMVLIYAWNETDEGGWLVPTRKEGTKRLDAIRMELDRRRR